MAIQRPLMVAANGALREVPTGDTVDPAVLGTGNGNNSTLLRGDGAYSALALAVATAAAWDPAKKAAGVTLSANNTVATFTATQQTVLALTGVTTGKYYFEVTFTSGTASGNCGIGLAPATEVLTGKQVGFDSSVGSIACYQNSGAIYKDGTGSGSGSTDPFSTVGQTLSVAFDATARRVWFKRNGGNWNGNPAYVPGDSNGIAVTGTAALFPAVCTDKVAAFTANFGGAAWVTPLPNGFSAWGAADTGVVTMGVSDVNVLSPVNGNLLQHDGSKWVNRTVATVMAAYAPLANPLFTGSVRIPIYTLTTMPAASAATNRIIVVSNATGGPAVCISNGTNWLNVRTNATVA